MNNTVPIISLEECKVQASSLLKSLKSTNPAKAIMRFKTLPEFSLMTNELVLTKAKRKHALEVIAIENNFATWAQLKKHCDQALSETFVNGYIGGHLNKWFAKYTEAKSEQKDSGGFLLPYNHQFFICDADYIAILGFDPKNPDWKAIGYDWVAPDNYKAWKRLNNQWRFIQKKRKGC